MTHQDSAAIPDPATLHVVGHPLILHKLSLMRDKACSTLDFRRLLHEISLLMGYELTRDLPLASRRIETPLVEMDAPVLAGRKLAVVPILRAGLAMSDALVELVPAARVGHIGLYRDPETHRPVEYLRVLPDPDDRHFILADPMLATGYSAIHAASILREVGVAVDHLRLMSLIAAPEGIRAFQEAHPGVPLWVAAIDSHLDDHAYIIPGLGDAGDRMFGTK